MTPDMSKARKPWWVVALLLLASGIMAYYFYDHRQIDLYWKAHLTRSAIVSAALIGVTIVCLRNKSDGPD